MDEVKFLPVSEISKKLKVTSQYVRSLIRNNQLEAIRIGSQWVSTPDAVKKYIEENDVIVEPDDHERIGDELPSIIALSFFSGAMGLDIGMKNVGIRALLACEFNKACRMTIHKNDPEIALIGDINQYSSDQILSMAKIPKDQKIDVIFGGPPCQAFSTAGNRKGFEDERGNVFLRFIQIVGEIRPKYVVIENVRGLLSAEYPFHNNSTPIKGGALLEILDRLTKYGYAVSFNLYNSANFGAPQSRERVVIIGKLGSKKVPYLLPTNSEEEKFNLPEWKTLGDALSTEKIVQHHFIQFPEDRLYYYRILKEGQYWKNLPEDLQKKALGKSFYLGGGKTGFYRRLSFSKPSPTLVTNPTMPATDLAHPVEDRPLSVEEYKCIQGFPQSWKICGSIIDQYRQIGNAVPIKLAEAIGRAVLRDMNGDTEKEPKEFPYSRYKNTDEISWKAEMEKMQKRKEISFYQETLL